MHKKERPSAAALFLTFVGQNFSKMKQGKKWDGGVKTEFYYSEFQEKRTFLEDLISRWKEAILDAGEPLLAGTGENKRENERKTRRLT